VFISELVCEAVLQAVEDIVGWREDVGDTACIRRMDISCAMSVW